LNTSRAPKPSRREQPTARTWERGRSDAVVKWVAATAWATVAAAVVGCAQPAPALTTPVPPTSLAAPVSTDEGERHGGGKTSVAYHEAGHALVAESREHADLAALLKSTEAER